jgi:branched-chain amino acid transport system substrate-binding protein
MKVFRFDHGEASTLQGIPDKVRSLAPDGIYMIGGDDDVAGLLRTIRGADIEAVFMGSSLLTCDIVRQAGPASEHLVLPCTGRPYWKDDPHARSFVEAYRTKHGEAPDVFAAYAYDSLQVLLHAMRTSGSTDPGDVKAVLSELHDYPGVTGRMSFDMNGDLVRYPPLHIVFEGELVRYDQFQDSGGSLKVPGRE